MIKHSRKGKGTGKGIYASSSRPSDTVYRSGYGQVRIKYTPFGEFEPQVTFRRSSLLEYLWQSTQASNRQPTLWIQNQPAQYNVRYPRGKESFKCRFENCPVSRRTIHKGMWRVAVDEFPDETGKTRDPFWNAGYVHLYCLEQKTDLYDLVRRGFVKADMRSFAYEARNPMALEEPYADVFQSWCSDEKVKCERHCSKWLGAGEKPPRRQLTKEDFLYYRLTETRLNTECPAREKARGRRDQAAVQKGSESVSHDKYMGDLTVYAKLVARQKAKQRGEQVDDADIPPIGRCTAESPSPSSVGHASPLASSPPTLKYPQGRGRKRNREVDDEEGSSIDVCCQHHCPHYPQKRQRRDVPQHAPSYGMIDPLSMSMSRIPFYSQPYPSFLPSMEHTQLAHQYPDPLQLTQPLPYRPEAHYTYPAPSELIQPPSYGPSVLSSAFQLEDLEGMLEPVAEVPVIEEPGKDITVDSILAVSDLWDTATPPPLPPLTLPQLDLDQDRAAKRKGSITYEELEEGCVSRKRWRVR
ncbi:hypothetical protein NKR23_g2927 [Pleurostoma richardsiae]|uniref:Uncharacterized protein n=1 Tax=Pleurostoma richardsiae TaxID=41990 RepID=A0AA38S0P0_9PEZI|nr:hypothetical protein NKR23_g2927 [Pleurostoma richardsiae]